LVLAQQIIPLETALELTDDQPRMNMDALRKQQHFLLREIGLNPRNEIV
jgi:hypothetical protein